MPLVLRPGAEKQSLAVRLGRVGQDRRRIVRLAGGARFLTLVLAGVLVVGGLDYLVRLPDFARAGLLVVLLIGWTAAFRRWVLRPWREASDALTMAHRLEARFPALGDALASAVDFLTTDRPGGLRFRQVAVVRAVNLTKRMDLAAVVPRRAAWREIGLATVLALVAGGLVVTEPAHSTRAVLRLLDPFGPHQFPTATLVELLNPADRLALGENYPVRVLISGVRPELATVEVRLADTDVTTSELVSVPAPAEESTSTESVRVESELDAGRVPRDFRFRVLAGDGASDWFAVNVAPAPRLIPLDGRASPQIRLEFPTYSDLPALELPDGAGVADMVAGTEVHFRAATDDPITQAYFAPQTDRTIARTALAVAPLAGENAFGVLAAELLAEALTADVPVTVAGPDHTHLSATFTPYFSGLYVLHFTSGTSGLVGTRLFDFRVTPDAVPTVLLDRPGGRDPLTVLPSAQIPIAARAEDRPFAVRSLHLEYRVGVAPWQELPLADWPRTVDVLPSVMGGSGGLIPKPATLAGSRLLPVATFRRADGQPVTDGDLVTVRAAAYDFDDRTVLKGPGRSREVELRVLGLAAIEAQIQRDLTAIRPEVLRLAEQLREAAAQTEDAKQAPAAADARAALTSAETAQREARTRVADPADGVRARVDRIRQTAEANRLPRSATLDKLTRAASTLDQLADSQLDAAEAAVSTAREALAKPNAKALLTDAQARQEAARRSVADLLATLEQWGGAGEVRGAARGLQEQVRRAADLAAANTDAARTQSADRLNQAAEQSADLLARATRLAAQKDSQAAERTAAGEATAAALAEAEAEALRDGVEKAGGEALPEELRRAANATRAGRDQTAAAARQAALERLDRLADPLADPPPPPAAPDTTGEELEAISEDLVLLRKKAKAAAALPDPAEREAELQKLADEQEALRRRTEAAAEKLARTSPPAAAAARAAAAAQEAARDRLDRGESPTTDQEQALDKLDEARDQTQPPPEPDEELLREAREQLTAQIQALRDQQKETLAEADRIQSTLLEDKEWDRALLVSLRDLNDRTEEFATAARAFGAEKLSTLPVFLKLMDQAADASTLAGKRIAERADLTDPASPFDLKGEEAQHRRVRVPLARSLAKLEHLVAALKATKPPAPGADPAAGGGAGAAAGADAPPPAGPKPTNGVPPLAQLKALRALQADVAEQTRAFAEEHPDRTKLSPEARAELKELEAAQRDVAVLFAQLAAEIGPPSSAPEAP